MAYLDRGLTREEIMAALYNGDRMNQKEFHALYEQTEEGFRAELLAGMVLVRESLGLWHGSSNTRLGTIFDTYSSYTPGVEVSSDATVILGKEDEVQPDVLLRIAPESGGQSKNCWYRDKKGRKKGPYVKGAPELVAEVAHSSRAIDLHLKRQRYADAGVIEYIVFCLAPKELHWIDLQKQSNIQADNGIFHSAVFPGLWIDQAGLLQNDLKRVMHVLDQGLASPEHASFVAQLARRKT